MTTPLRPRLRSLEITPVRRGDDVLFALRDAEGFGRPMTVPYGGVLLAALMDGKRTLAEIQAAFLDETGVAAALTELIGLVEQLDGAYLLEGERFQARRQEEIEKYQASPTRPAFFAGASYPADAEALRQELAGYFAAAKASGNVDPDVAGPGGELCGVISPHIDPYRGGPVFARAYEPVARHCEADRFVIFGTAHRPMDNLFCVTRKDFETPLGRVETDTLLIDRLAEHLASSLAGRQIDLEADEPVHRSEHSIEFQAVFLQYLLGGKRPWQIVPVLVGSFQPFIDEQTSPEESPQFQAFLAAMRAAADGHPGRVCYVSGADLAHVGTRFGDPWTVDARRLEEQSADDRRLLEAVCRADAAGVFRHVAGQQDRRRICGLPPIYTMLELISPADGRLLAYQQAIEPDGSGCVSFASVAYYR